MSCLKVICWALIFIFRCAVCLHFEHTIIKYDVLSEYLTSFWIAVHFIKGKSTNRFCHAFKMANWPLRGGGGHGLTGKFGNCATEISKI